MKLIKKRLINQIQIVLEILEKQYSEQLSRGGVLENIQRKYKLALEKIELDKDLNALGISGGVRAYLDSHTDYDNPLLVEMGKAEKMADKIQRGQSYNGY
ncbi:hypothetical protein [Virgibacillus sp. MSJ-26]|uniref:hypothetical protein n=1 Tax=Virgibacillus sp. MSJ-26 TaxID=2841522 RepID=UPI0020A17717|nr:hypothetical protein [Virgibacillus sp. MSJ-26]